MTSSKNYLRSQVVANIIINVVANGAIAYFMYRTRETVRFIDIAFDVPITVAILAFLISWLAILSTRKEIAADKLSGSEAGHRFPIKLPTGAVLRALVLTVALVLVYAGLVLVVPAYFISPCGMSGWEYILFKTFYTGTCAGLAAAVAIASVLSEQP